MAEDPLFQNKYRIASSRLAGWDYSSAGYYFVTLCTKNRVTCFGKVENSEVVFSEIGKIAQEYWQAIPFHCPTAEIDEFIIMPNHVHGIIILKTPEVTAETLHPDTYPDPGETLHPDIDFVETLQCNVSTKSMSDLRMSLISPKAGSLSAIIRSYKSAVTYWCHKNGFPEFAWQSRFFDRIIENDQALQAAQQYIQNNPINWELDKDKLENLWI